MNVAVIGAGVVGVTAAHYLNQAGLKVSVFDQHEAPAMGTSRANGAQLSYSYTDAFGSPGLIAKLPGILLGLDSAFKIRPSLSLSFMRWGLAFLSNCSNSKFKENSLAMLEMAMRSDQAMQELNKQIGNDYAWEQPGKMVLLAKPADDSVRDYINQKASLGCDARLMTRQDALALEPSLEQWNTDFAEVIYSEGDQVGDPFKFCTLLCDKLEQQGVEFAWNQTVEDLVIQNNKVVGIKLGGQQRDFDAVIVCTAHDPSGLLKRKGIKLPIVPVAGYSVTLPQTEQAPKASITVQSEKFVLCRLADEIRIAGFADVNQPSKTFESRIRELLACSSRVAPKAADYSVANAKPWVGYRPTTPSSVPIVRQSKVNNLYLNMGHGTLGWTLAAASGEMIRDLITG